MSDGQIIVKGPDRLTVFLDLVDLYHDKKSKTLIKVEDDEGAAFISGKNKKVKILTENWRGADPEDLPDKNRLL
jgi:hypothetical protein